MSSVRDPIVIEVQVPAEPMQAFVAFTAQMGQWWDPLLTPSPATYTSVEMDPDGDVAFKHEAEGADDTFVWGRVTGWDPSGHLEMDFWLDHEQAPPSTLDVRFVPAPEAGSIVTLTHGGWTESNASVRERITFWPELMQRYAAHASR